MVRTNRASRMPEVDTPVSVMGGYTSFGRDSVVQAIAEIAAGRAVVVTDDADRENEGDLIFAAEAVTTETMAFVVRHTSGVVCIAMPGERLDALGLYPMVEKNEDPKATAFTVTVDRKGGGVTTGISASDRANSLRWLANPTASASDFNRPGHIFPLRACAGGVLERDGHTEAAVDLARLAGLQPAGGLCEIVRDSDGGMARADDLDIFRKEHGLVLTTIADLQQYIRETEGRENEVPNRALSEPAISFGPVTRMPTSSGDFDALCCLEGPIEHLALIRGCDISLPPKMVHLPETNGKTKPKNGASNGASKPASVPLVRVHSECATGDLFGSRRCDCGEQLDIALRDIAQEESGVLLYVRGHEGRGIGLGSKLRAYALQDAGRDTIEANTDQGLPIDARSYKAAARILIQLGLTEVRLMTNNPAKCIELEANGVTVVERVPLVTTPNEVNFKYLLTKQRQMGHVLNLPDEYQEKEA